MIYFNQAYFLHPLALLLIELSLWARELTVTVFGDITRSGNRTEASLIACLRCSSRYVRMA